MSLPTVVEATLTPHMLGAYLAAKGWALEETNPERHDTWLKAPTRGEEPARILLPRNQRLRDFRRRLQEAIWGLEEYYGLSTFQLTDEVAAVRADVLFVRLDQVTVDGTIPFRQATSLLDSIQRMVRAAATTTANPASTHKGRRPAQVTDFLEDDLRFGHTRHGSFVVTVVARHDDGPSVPAEPAEPDDRQSFVIEPFPRRVMTTLARSLAVTAEAASSGSVAAMEAATQQPGVSLELVQSLIDVTEPGELRAVDLNFQWATGVAPPPVPAQVVIEREAFPQLQALNDRLQKQVPPRDVTLFGRVKSLTRDELEDGVEDSAIVLEADIDGRLRNVTVPLSTEDYDWALMAHRARLPFTVSGELVRRRTWRLEGEVRADVEFLRHHLGDAGSPPPKE